MAKPRDYLFTVIQPDGEVKVSVKFTGKGLDDAAYKASRLYDKYKDEPWTKPDTRFQVIPES